ncbi:MAG: hypothetical protein NVV82_20115 [Sporocytophaga sp.]|nr:hypothetical protein [Sporocytophaga sp.]
MTVKGIAIVSLSTLTGMTIAIIANFFILDKILIPDPCYYHNHKTNIIFDMFYDLPAHEGFHPYPTIFNFIFTIALGGMCGYVFSSKKIRIL